MLGVELWGLEAYGVEDRVDTTTRTPFLFCHLEHSAPEPMTAHCLRDEHQIDE
jgi:hypothetical protein